MLAKFTLAAMLAATSVTALAQIEAFDFTLVPGAPEGYVTTDISITGTGQWTGFQMLLETQEGSIFQHEMGGVTAPRAAVVDLSSIFSRPMLPSTRLRALMACGSTRR